MGRVAPLECPGFGLFATLQTLCSNKICPTQELFTYQGKELKIPVDIRTDKIIVLGVGKENHWVKLEPTESPSLYMLYTTKELGIPEEKFKIDVLAGTSGRVD